MKVFDRIRPYGFIHHRALNDFSALSAAIETAGQYPTFSHVLEGDICWFSEDGRTDLYFRHPSYVFDALTPAQIDQGKRESRLVTIEHLLSADLKGANLVLELKVGRGDWRRAIARLIELLESNFSGRYWIDGFSLSMLSHIRKTFPSVPSTLHTELMLGDTVLIGAPEWPPIGFRNVRDLDEVDGVAIRWHGTNSYMHKSSAAVLGAGKKLFLSRIHSLGQYSLSREWGAHGGYPHCDFRDVASLESKMLSNDRSH